jgi:hypothetical protein
MASTSWLLWGTAMNMGVQTSPGDPAVNSFVHIPRSGIVGSEGNLLFCHLDILKLFQEQQEFGTERILLSLPILYPCPYRINTPLKNLSLIHEFYRYYYQGFSPVAQEMSQSFNLPQQTPESSG